MELILTVLLLGGIWSYFKNQEKKAFHYINSHDIDFGKMREDKVLNNISNSEMYRNAMNGKYDEKNNNH